MTGMETPAELRQRLHRLAALWRTTLARGPHPAGCTCMGHFLIPAMTARDMEADILGIMRHRYAEAALHDLVALLDARADARDATPFGTWLVTLADAPAPTLGRFIDDLTDTLDSFAPDSRARTPPSGFVCL
jgi:hypothetical protein